MTPPNDGMDIDAVGRLLTLNGPNRSRRHDLVQTPISRRALLQGVAGLGIGAAFGPLLGRLPGAFATGVGTGTGPEQVHLTFAMDSVNNPTNSMVVSWVQPNPTSSPSVRYDLMTNGIGSSSPTAPGSLNTLTSLNAVAPSSLYSYQDQLNGLIVYAYSALLTGLEPGTAYVFTITDGAGTTYPTTAAPGAFSTAASGRTAFRFTSYGDLASPNPFASASAVPSSDQYSLLGLNYTAWPSGETSPNAYEAVNVVEYFNPLFHLLNGDLAYADKTPTTQPQVWRDFGINMERSAMHRPWMPCLGNHETEISNGYDSYLSRFKVPGNGTSYPGRFYTFQVGSVLFVSLDANDVAYQDAAPYQGSAIAGTAGAGGCPAGATGRDRYYSGAPSTNTDDTNLLVPGSNAQSVWLQNVLASARPTLAPSVPTSPITPISWIVPSTIDWIVVQTHHCAMSSANDNGCDLGIRSLWRPLFDQYQVDLVVSGHDHDYERTYPVRGYNPTVVGKTVSGSNPVQTLQPVAMTGALTAGSGPGSPPTSADVVDTTQGTVYIVLGGGGTNHPDNTYQASGGLASSAPVTTQLQSRTSSTKPPADSYEPNPWSYVRDSGGDSYGIAVIDVDPGSTPGGQTTLTIKYYHAPTPSSQTTQTVVPPTGIGNYSLFDWLDLTRPRSDSGIGAATPEFATPVLSVGGAALLGAGALLVEQHRRSARFARQSGTHLVSGTPDN